MSELLRLTGVSKSYRRGDRRLRVLEGASLALDEGMVGAVVGSRLEGKTTLLRIAAGMEQPDAGSVSFAGQELYRLAASVRERLWGHEISWVHREGTWLGFDALEYVAMPLRLGQKRPAAGDELALKALERVGAAELVRRRWEELSNWERLLVGFARGIVGQPRLLIIDDALEGFNMARTSKASELLRELAVELNCAVLLSASEVEAAFDADWIWTIESRSLRLLYVGDAPDSPNVIEFPDADGRRQSA